MNSADPMTYLEENRMLMSIAHRVPYLPGFKPSPATETLLNGVLLQTSKLKAHLIAVMFLCLNDDLHNSSSGLDEKFKLIAFEMLFHFL